MTRFRDQPVCDIGRPRSREFPSSVTVCQPLWSVMPIGANSAHVELSRHRRVSGPTRHWRQLRDRAVLDDQVRTADRKEASTSQALPSPCRCSTRWSATSAARAPNCSVRSMTKAAFSFRGSKAPQHRHRAVEVPASRPRRRAKSIVTDRLPLYRPAIRALGLKDRNDHTHSANITQPRSTIVRPQGVS